MAEDDRFTEKVGSACAEGIAISGLGDDRPATAAGDGDVSDDGVGTVGAVI